MKTLETCGITVSFNGAEYHFKGTVSMVVAVNLAAHALGGFFCNSSTVQRFCRFCNIRRDQLNQRNLISKFALRTDNAYNNNIAAIEEDPDSSALHRLKKRSVSNELHYYHVANGLSPDLALDLFEGFAVDVVSNVIISFIREVLFELDELNNLILNFNYSESDKGRKPQIIKKPL